MTEDAVICIVDRDGMIFSDHVLYVEKGSIETLGVTLLKQWNSSEKAKQLVSDSATTTDASSYKIANPYIKYNVTYDEDVKNRKQYFVDMFTFKGNAAYLPENIAEYPASLSNGFHLDCRADINSYEDLLFNTEENFENVIDEIGNRDFYIKISAGNAF